MLMGRSRNGLWIMDVYRSPFKGESITTETVATETQNDDGEWIRGMMIPFMGLIQVSE